MTTDPAASAVTSSSTRALSNQGPTSGDIGDGERTLIGLIRSESALLAALPFVGSFLVYVYQYGYLNYFGIPAALIDLDLSKVITATAILAGAGAAYAWFIALFADLISAKHPILKALGRSTFFLPFVVPFWIFAETPTANRLWFMAVLIGINFASELIPTRDKTKPYLQRVADAQQLVSEHARKPSNFVTGMAWSNVVVPTLLALLFSTLVAQIGRSVAKNQFVYWTLEDNSQTYVFVATYGDSAIFKSVDLKARKIGDLLLVRSLDEMHLREVSTGELIGFELKSTGTGTRNSSATEREAAVQAK